MKVVFINPPTATGHLSFMIKQYPLNLMMLAAYARARGLETAIWDFAVETFSEEELLQRIRTDRPDLVGLTSPTATIGAAGVIAGHIKRSYPEITTVIGGVHASALPERTLKGFPAFDCLVHGEGEKTLVELMAAGPRVNRWSGIQGIAYRDGGRIVVNPPRELEKNLDDFPFPARDLIRRDLYRRNIVRWRSAQCVETDYIITSRGCVGKCIFCGVNTVFQGRVRFRSAENILDEIKECRDRYQTQHLTIVDDTFVVARDRLAAICSGIKNLKLDWTCFGRVDLVDEEKIKIIAEAGCAGIEFGVESGSQRILDLMKKGVTVEQIRTAFALAHKYGLATDATVIVGGHPSETADDIRLTEKLLREIRPGTFVCSTLIPFPGTEINRILKEKGYLGEEIWEDYTMFGANPPDYRTDYFTSRELKKIQDRMLRRFYFHPRFIIRKLMSIRSTRDLKYWIKIGTDFIREYIFRRARRPKRRAFPHCT